MRFSVKLFFYQVEFLTILNYSLHTTEDAASGSIVQENGSSGMYYIHTKVKWNEQMCNMFGVCFSLNLPGIHILNSQFKFMGNSR